MRGARQRPATRFGVYARRRLRAAPADRADLLTPIGGQRLIIGLAHDYTEFDWSVLGLVAAEAAGSEDQADAE